jgi:hypothetical protein
MEIVERANLKNKNDRLGMILELAVFQALKNISLYVVRHSQFNEFYQQDRGIGPDFIFEFGNKKMGVIECKNLKQDFIVSEDWFNNKVEDRFFPKYKGLDAYFVVISQFQTSPQELAHKIERGYFIVEVGFQITDLPSYEAAIPIIQNQLYLITESLNGHPVSLK